MPDAPSKFLCDNQTCLCNRCRHRRWAESGWCMCGLDAAEGECRPEKQSQPIEDASDCNWGFDEGKDRLTFVLCEHQREEIEKQAGATKGPEHFSISVRCSECGHVAGTIVENADREADCG